MHKPHTQCRSSGILYSLNFKNMKKLISVGIKNELTVKIENKFPDDISEIMIPLDYINRTDIEECLKQETWELFTKAVKRKFNESKIRAARLK